jgi:hypothetical protein
MARIFTTKFVYNQQSYDAIITVVHREGQMNFTVKVLDMELFELLPEGFIEYKGKDGFLNADVIKDQATQSLMKSISKSIETHLSTRV